MAQVTELVEALSNDQYRLRQLPRLHELRADLTAHGLDGLLRECAARELDCESAIAAFAHAWQASLLDLAIYGETAYASFQGNVHGAAIREFREGNRTHIEDNVTRFKAVLGRCPRRWSARFSRETSSLMS
jgi:hypothetical protein